MLSVDPNEFQRKFSTQFLTKWQFKIVEITNDFLTSKIKMFHDDDDDDANDYYAKIKRTKFNHDAKRCVKDGLSLLCMC